MPDRIQQPQRHLKRSSTQFREVACFLSAAALACALSATARSAAQSSASPRDQLQEYVTQLQANPSDDALRTKLIQLALTLDPKPTVPDAAAVAAAKGKAIFADATSPDDLKAAAAAFAQASSLAPWVPDYYYNEGLALDTAKQYDDAIHALNFYLLAAPHASDATDVRGKIEAIQYDKESAAKQAELQAEQGAQAAEEQQRQFASRLIGTWKLSEGGDAYNIYALSINDGNTFHLNWTGYNPGSVGGHSPFTSSEYVGKIAGGQIAGSWSDSGALPAGFCGNREYSFQETGTFTASVSDDGQSLVINKSGTFVTFAPCRLTHKSDQAEVFKKD